MNDAASQHFVGLDIGTSTVRCVIGTVDSDNKLSVVGYGSSKNIGMRRGVVIHVDDVAQAIRDAITEAERVSGIRVSGATVNINGSHVQGVNSKGVVAISSANREITHEDRMRVEEAATIVNLPPNREIIQVFAKNYRLDGQDNIKDPIGMQGVRLEVDTHIVTASTPNLRNLDLALERAEVTPYHHTVSSLAAAEAVLTRQQKESGTLLLDIGAGTTNLVVLEDGEVQHVGVIPIGGMHITNDLAIGLKTDLEIAEAVKIQYGGLSQAVKKKNISVTYNGQKHDFDAEEAQMIIEARVDELLELVDKELKKVGKSQKLPGGVVLVGGTSKLPGIDEVAKERLRLSARIGSLQPIGGLQDNVNDVSYSTAVGLTVLDMLLYPGVQTHSGQYGKAVNSIFNKLMGRLKK